MNPKDRNEIQSVVDFLRCDSIQREIDILVLRKAKVSDAARKAEVFFQARMNRTRRDNRRILRKIRWLNTLSNVPVERKLYELLKIVKNH